MPLNCALFYRLLLNLGSFPYITEPEPYLTFDVFRLGLIILSGKYSEHRAYIDYGKRKDARFVSCQYRRMMFQALAKTMSETKSSKLSEERTDSDDEDLLDALRFLDGTQQWDGPDECVGYDAAPFPTPTSLPSSSSTNLDGHIDWDEMKDFLKALLELKIRGIDIVVDRTPDLRQAVDSIIAAIENSMPGKAGNDVNWSTFDTIFDILIVRDP